MSKLEVRGVVCGLCFRKFRGAEYGEPAAALKAHYLAVHGGLA